MQPIGEISNAFQKWVKFDFWLRSNGKRAKKHRLCCVFFKPMQSNCRGSVSVTKQKLFISNLLGKKQIFYCLSILLF